MNTCPNCGVRVEDEHSHCPLCGLSLGGEEEEPGQIGPQPEPSASDTRPRFWLMEVVSLLAAVGAIVVFAADFAFGFSLSWSRLPLAAIVYVWIVLVASIGLGRRGLLLGTVITAATLLFLLSIDLVTGGPAWFVGLAAPLVVLAAALAGALIRLGRLRGVSTLPAIAMAFLGGGVYAVGVELLITRYRGGVISASWSIVVLACAIALALVVRLIHRRLRRRHTSLERIFHM